MIVLEDSIKRIISEITYLSIDEIQSEDMLKSLGIDSLLLVELIITIEEVFNITFDQSDLNPERLITVKSIVDLAIKNIRR